VGNEYFLYRMLTRTRDTLIRYTLIEIKKKI